MQAFLISIGKWLVTAVIVPLIKEAVLNWHKAQEKVRASKEKLKRNKEASSKYEENTNSDTFSKLP